MKHVLVIALGGMLCSATAYAQSTEPAADAAAAQDVAPAGEAAASVAVTDAEVESFAQATVKLQEIEADASIATEEKQAAMAAAVQEAGLDPVKYNEIAQAVGTDTALRAKIVDAMGRVSGGAQPAG